MGYCFKSIYNSDKRKSPGSNVWAKGVLAASTAFACDNETMAIVYVMERVMPFRLGASGSNPSPTAAAATIMYQLTTAEYKPPHKLRIEESIIGPPIH